MNSFVVRSAVGLLGLSIAACASPQGVPVRVRVNGQRVFFQGPGPRRENGRVMVPLRGVFERLGARVAWDDASQTVMADRGDMDIRLTIGNDWAMVNDRRVPMDEPANIYNGSTFVPLRFVSEALGAQVTWDGDRNAVDIMWHRPGSGDRNQARRRVPPRS